MENASEERVFQLVLSEELRRPVFLTSNEVIGGWRTLFPDLAGCLPTPYPIFGHDETRVVTYGYPVRRSDGVRKLQRTFDALVHSEVEYRVQSELEGSADKSNVMTDRDRAQRSLSPVMENVFMNDYGRGLSELALLFFSAEIVRSVSKVPKLARSIDRHADDASTSRHRQEIAGVFGDLMQRAAHDAFDRLRKLAGVRSAPKSSPLLTTICSECPMLAEQQPPKDLRSLDGFLRSRYRVDATTLTATLTRSMDRLTRLMARRSEVADLLAVAAGTSIDLTEAKSLLEPRLLKALARAELLDTIGLTKAQATVCRKLGLDLKRFELLAALRRRIVIMDRQGNQLVLSENTSQGPIAPTTRPFDFTAPGVVDNSVRRFGLIYDLTNFTAILEDVRKTGRVAEEKALQFMYVFQNRLEIIRHTYRLMFEKFLGDGAFYSSRRALRILAAACEIQQVYDGLRRSGFPFDQGIRMALNHSVYRLLPMIDSDQQVKRFEFFGHGIVELARLTTGKSTREVSEIAEFLIHAGYPAVEVENFLAPIATARSTGSLPDTRTYAAAIDGHGDLVNEGMVLTFEFLEHLDTELEASGFIECSAHGRSWLLLPLDPDRPDRSVVGLRYLGVARLKGLAPLELVEAEVWPEAPAEVATVPRDAPLTELLRRLANPGGDPRSGDEPDAVTIDEDLVVVSYLDGEGARQWIFGRHRPGDDVLLQAIQMPMQIPTIDEDEPLETWLFRNRYELERLYFGLRRNDPGATIPVTPLRRRSGYVGCFLAAPHKAP